MAVTTGSSSGSWVCIFSASSASEWSGSAGPEVDCPWPLGPALLGPILLLPAPRAPSLELPYPQTSRSGAQGFNLAVHPYMPQNTAN